MSYEQCIYLQESVADCSLISSSDTNQLSLLSGSLTPVEYSGSEQKKDGFKACTCGKEMSGCSIHPNTPEAWIASMQDSLAKTLALLESRQAYLKEPDQVFTEKSCVLLTQYDQNSSSWRTLQQSFLTDSEPFSETWPRWGMTLDGAAYAHPMSERRITETDGSCWLPTPTASDPQLERRAKHGIHFQTSTGTVRRKNEDGTSSMLGLAGFVKMWPTPTAHNAKECNAKECNAKSESERNTPTLAAQVGGKLNPDWVGWLMAFPIGWANSKATETRKSRSKQQQHSNSCTDKEAA